MSVFTEIIMKIRDKDEQYFIDNDINEILSQDEVITAVRWMQDSKAIGVLKSFTQNGEGLVNALMTSYPLWKPLVVTGFKERITQAIAEQIKHKESGMLESLLQNFPYRDFLGDDILMKETRKEFLILFIKIGGGKYVMEYFKGNPHQDWLLTMAENLKSLEIKLNDLKEVAYRKLALRILTEQKHLT